MIKYTLFSLIIACIFLTTRLQGQSIKSEIITEDNVSIQKIYFLPNGKISEQHFLIDQDEWVVEINTYFDTLLIKTEYFTGDKNFVNYEYVYNDNNQIEVSMEIANDTVVSVSYFTYNEQNQLKKESTENNNGKLIIEYEYNEAGRIDARFETIENTDETINNSEYFDYNDKGLMTNSIQLSGVDTMVYHTYFYDEMNRCSEMYIMSGGDTISRIERKFLKDLDLISKETHLSDGYVVRQEKYKYNSNNVLAKKTIIDYRIFPNMPAPKKVVYRYKYSWFKEQ
jgi:hypothetical protein